MRRDNYVQILRLLHFTDSNNEPEYGRKFCQITKDTKYVWNSKQDIFKILQSWTPGCRWSYCFVPRKGHFPTIHTQETQMFWRQIYKPCDETGYTCDMTVYSLLVDTSRTNQGLVSFGQWRWRSQNVVCELQTVWIEKFLVKCGGSMMCVCVCVCVCDSVECCSVWLKV